MFHEHAYSASKKITKGVWEWLAGYIPSNIKKKFRQHHNMPAGCYPGAKTRMSMGSKEGVI